MICTDPRRIAEWAAAHRIADLYQWSGIAQEDKSGIRCAVIYNYFCEQNINAHILSDGSKRWATREFLWAMFHYPFVQLGINRITAPIAESNLDARRFVEKLGFVEEGRLANYYANGDSLLLYGLQRNQCKYV